jgi:hypothetical protein
MLQKKLKPTGFAPTSRLLRFMLVTLPVLAVVGLGVILVAGASAEEKAVMCHADAAGGAGERDTCLFVAKAEVTRTEEEFTGKAEGNAKLKVAGGPEISCTAANASGKIIAQADGVAVEPLTITLEACSVVGQATCTVTTPITLTARGQFFKPSEILFVEKALGPIAQITISGAGCPFVVTGAKLVGNQRCTTPVTIESEGFADTLKCAEADSDLEYNKSDAKLTLSERIEIGGKLWAIGKS